MQQEAIIFARLEQLVSNFWYTFDDEVVRREVTISHYDRESYLCFYEITGTSRDSLARAQAQVKPRQVEVTRISQLEGAVASKMGYEEVVSNSKVIDESQSKVLEEPSSDKPMVKKEETNNVIETEICGKAVEHAVEGAVARWTVAR